MKNFYGASRSDAVFHIVTAPMMTPMIPKPIANARKFFFSAML